MSPLTTTAVPRIRQLASELDQLGKSALDKAAEAGRLLTECKNGMGHGQWLPWIQSNFNFSYRTAGRWMKIAEEKAAGKLKLDSVSNLSEAYRITSNPKPEIPETPLTPVEQSRLAELEGIIDRGLEVIESATAELGDNEDDAPPPLIEDGTKDTAAPITPTDEAKKRDSVCLGMAKDRVRKLDAEEIELLLVWVEANKKTLIANYAKRLAKKKKEDAEDAKFFAERKLAMAASLTKETP